MLAIKCVPGYSCDIYNVYTLTLKPYQKLFDINQCSGARQAERIST